MLRYEVGQQVWLVNYELSSNAVAWHLVQDPCTHAINSLLFRQAMIQSYHRVNVFTDDQKQHDGFIAVSNHSVYHNQFPVADLNPFPGVRQSDWSDYQFYVPYTHDYDHDLLHLMNQLAGGAVTDSGRIERYDADEWAAVQRHVNRIVDDFRSQTGLSLEYVDEPFTEFDRTPFRHWLIR